MKVKLLRDARIQHKAGEIVEVSPDECFFLTSTDGAVIVSDAVKAPVEVPEKADPAVEVPEKTTKAVAKKPATKKK